MEITGAIPSIRLLRRALNALNRGHVPSLPLDGGPDRRTAAALRALLARRGPVALRRAIDALR
ncbi:MAG TPA: hypothetical protein VGO55_16905 [Allosphingosinicella sp.]|jgi:hypothetical protein|nr:hypothetical protein [Allosphingosinicella sp.]